MKAKGLHRLIAFVSLGLVLVVTPAVMSAQEQGTIRIGAPLRVTGVQAGDSLDGRDGLVLAVEEINTAGGVLGKRLEVITADTKEFSAEDMRTAALLLERYGVAAAFTPFAKGPMLVHTFAKFDYPLLHGATCRVTVREQKRLMDTAWNLIQMDPTEEAYAPRAWKVMTELIPYQLPNKKVAVFSSDHDYSNNIRKDFVRLATAAGWEVVLNTKHPYGNTEFGPQLSRIRAENPAIILSITDPPPEAVAFTKQFRANPTDSLVYIQYAPSLPEYREMLGELANGILWQTVLDSLPDEKIQGRTSEFQRKFEKRFGREPGTYAPALYDWVHAWKLAVEAVGDEKNYRGVIDYLVNGPPYQGICGEYGINPEYHCVEITPHFPNFLYQIQEGKDVLLFLYDEKWAEFQTPPWLRKE